MNREGVARCPSNRFVFHHVSLPLRVAYINVSLTYANAYYKSYCGCGIVYDKYVDGRMEMEYFSISIRT